MSASLQSADSGGHLPSHPDFEDYLQELRLMLFERARRYPDEGIFRNENEVNYLFGFCYGE